MEKFEIQFPTDQSSENFLEISDKPDQLIDNGLFDALIESFGKYKGKNTLSRKIAEKLELELATPRDIYVNASEIEKRVYLNLSDEEQEILTLMDLSDEQRQYSLLGTLYENVIETLAQSIQAINYIASQIQNETFRQRFLDLSQNLEDLMKSLRNIQIHTPKHDAINQTNDSLYAENLKHLQRVSDTTEVKIEDFLVEVSRPVMDEQLSGIDTHSGISVLQSKTRTQLSPPLRNNEPTFDNVMNA